MKTLVTTIMLISLCAATAFSEAKVPFPDAEATSSEAEAPGRAWRIGDGQYWKGYIGDTGSIITSPARWDKSDWLKASLVLGATGGLFALDEDIKEWVQDNRNGTTDEIASYAKPFGEPKYVLPPVALLYVYGHSSDNPKARRAALLSFESAAVAGLFTQVLKFSFHRHRPSSGDPYDTFDGPSLSFENLALPSGHSSFAWSVMTVLALEYRDKPLIPPLAYGAAALAALSRVNDNAHWASDAFFGSALGYFTARAIVRMDENKLRMHESGKAKVTVVPQAGEGYAGLTAVMMF